MPPKEKSSPLVPALEKALDILEYAAHKGGPVAIKEVADALSIPQSSAYRTIKYLSQRRYLREADGAYSVGTQIPYLAHLIARQTSLISEAEAPMRDLATRTGQTVQLGVLAESAVIYIDQRLPVKPVSIIAELQTPLPVNVSACGKVLVAHLNDGELEAFLEHAPLAERTKNSIVDVERFREELTRVRASGYAVDHEEYARGIGCVAAPIWNFQERVVAAIGITGPIALYRDPQRFGESVASVVEAAGRISDNLGSPGRAAAARNGSRG